MEAGVSRIISHEWRVNRAFQPGVAHLANTSPGGHCDVAFGTNQKIYNKDLKCTMHSSMWGNPDDAEPRDGIVGFHYVKVGQTPDSEYLRIPTAAGTSAAE